LKVIEYCEFCFNGIQTVQLATQIILDKVAVVNSLTQDNQIEKTYIKPIDLMLLDFQMPELNGIEVFKRIKALVENTNFE
jgi:CheY-like chemotaxis protein